MRVAIIDLGTNSVRFDVHQIGPGGKVRTLHREKLMVRLGQGVFTEGRLDTNAIRRTLQAFQSFKQTSDRLHCTRVVAFGTSALRDASDSHRLLQQIKKRTQIEVRVISGEEEARLIALGILAHHGPFKGRVGLIDIGGGSTEITICRGSKILTCASFPLGTARLQQVFLKRSPPRPDKSGDPNPISQLRKYVRGALLPKITVDNWPKVPRMLGSSGTIRAILKLLKKRAAVRSSIEIGPLQKLVEEMSTMTTTQLLGLPGMEPKRVDMILAGAILLEECMLAVKAKKVQITELSLRDGILEEQVQLLKQHQESQLAFHLEDLEKKAARLMGGELHFRQVTRLAQTLFDRLAPLHKLAPSWRTYLSAAAILHDVGEAVTPANHEIHSYYIVRNANFPSMESWECEFIAQLCLWHQGGGKVPEKDIPFHKDRRIMTAFHKLLALLRVADAMDRSHKAFLSIKSVRIDRRQVKILLGSRNGSDLEILRVEQKKDLFESVFKRELVVRAG